jgi:hypothetical protein
MFIHLFLSFVAKPVAVFYPVVKSSMSDSLEAKIIELHLRHYTHDEIIAVLETGKPRLSRCIRQFHQTALIPDASTGTLTIYMTSPVFLINDLEDYPFHNSSRLKVR